MEMYTIKGADGNEYGPVDANVIREWIVQARANAQTMARRGNEGYKQLSEFMEFSHDLGLDAPSSSSSGKKRSKAEPEPEEKPKLKMKAGAARTTAKGSTRSPISLGTPDPGPSSSFLAPGEKAAGEMVGTLMSPIAGSTLWFKLAAAACVVYVLLTAALIYYLREIIQFDWAYLPTFAFFHLMLPGTSAYLFWRISSLSQTAMYSNDGDSAAQCQNSVRSLGLLFGIAAIVFLGWTAYFGYQAYSHWDELKMLHMMLQQQLEQQLMMQGGGFSGQ